jgi:plasmid stabilization system protein ParE
MPRVLFTEAARADLAEAVDWHDAHAAHMVRQFQESLRAAVARSQPIQSNFPLGLIGPAAPCFGAFPTS